MIIYHKLYLMIWLLVKYKLLKSKYSIIKTFWEAYYAPAACYIYLIIVNVARARVTHLRLI